MWQHSYADPLTRSRMQGCKKIAEILSLLSVSSGRTPPKMLNRFGGDRWGVPPRGVENVVSLRAAASLRQPLFRKRFTIQLFFRTDDDRRSILHSVSYNGICPEESLICTMESYYVSLALIDLLVILSVLHPAVKGKGSWSLTYHLIPLICACCKMTHEVGYTCGLVWARRSFSESQPLNP